MRLSRAVIASLALGSAARAQPQATNIDIRLREGTNIAAAVSPDGRSIAFDLIGRIWVIPRVGGSATALTAPLDESRQPVWSPDGARIAFQSYRDGTWHIWSIANDGSDPQQHTFGTFDDREPDYTADGRIVLVPEAFDTVMAGRDTAIGRIGAFSAPAPIVRTRMPVGRAMAAGLVQTGQDLDLVVATIRGLMAGRVSPKDLAGPIGIGQISGQAARQGLAELLWLIAVISVNLAVFNLLPVPVLDGGHLVFLLVEAVRGRPLTLETRYRFMQVGMGLLLLLVVFVFYNDIRRLVGF